MTFKSLITGAALTAASIVAVAPAAQAQALQLGQLNCQVAGGAGFIFGSSKELDCTFTPASGEPETYTGTIDKFGIDIGVTGEQVILWTVVAADGSDYNPGDLKGTYSGATAGAAFVAGLGANVLVGGGDTIALQPVSVSATTGVNVAVGLASVTLN